MHENTPYGLVLRSFDLPLTTTMSLLLLSPRLCCPEPASRSPSDCADRGAPPIKQGLDFVGHAFSSAAYEYDGAMADQMGKKKQATSDCVRSRALGTLEPYHDSHMVKHQFWPNVASNRTESACRLCCQVTSRSEKSPP